MKKYVISVVVILVFMGLVIGLMDVHYNNAIESIKADIEGQYKVNESDYEKMTRIIMQKAGVTSKYANDLKEVVKINMNGRYGSDGSKAMWQWIKEHNINIDSSIYKSLGITIEAQRTAFSRRQEKIARMVAAYNKMLKTRPSKWFVDGEEMVANIVSSSKTKEIMNTGVDNSSNDIFK